MILDNILEKTPQELCEEFKVDSDKYLVLVDIRKAQYSYRPQEGSNSYGPHKISKILKNNQTGDIARTLMFYTTENAFLEQILAVFKDSEHIKPGELKAEHINNFFDAKSSKIFSNAIKEYNE